ncbi:hypothetical protein G7Z17_g2012 [Cylindrodendrum hubeiense]|uniref:MACPF domain-containing protein n=1 Tax=Cylindrodendrum hubeiense TaxID=595255 RepID=A0A9P5HJN2_9HYPO|nr:hypothetical protein G7Z17_g2012 [Cylindrodendrum hubeiense]
MSNQEQVPFNTYDQSGCVHDAVRITRGPTSAENSNDVEVIYNADEMTDYTKFVKSLDISAGAGVSMFGMGGGVDAEFLDREEFEASFLTYLVKVDIRQQPSSKSRYSFNWNQPTDPHATYGDRFVSDFVMGGALFARVSIITKDTSMHEEIKEAANAAFPVYGVDVKVTQAVQTSIEKIQKHSEVHIYLHYVGVPPTSTGSTVGSTQGDEPDSLLQLKRTADAFLAKADAHRWKRFALLEKYVNIPDWKQQFAPLNYDDAEDESWTVFNDFTEYVGIRKTIRQIKEDHYIGGRVKRDSLDSNATSIIGGYRKWVATVKQTPEAAKKKPEYDPPQKFCAEVLLAVQSTRYIAQRLRLPDNRSTDIIDTRLYEGSKVKKLFEVEGYNFGEVTGITNLIFQKKRDGDKDKYSCIIGRDKTPGYDTVSELWVASSPIKGVFDQRVDVVPVFETGCIELELQEGAIASDVLFSFYVRKV